jgi:hypothetical protein
VITCGGRPKARLVGLAASVEPFRVNRRLLQLPVRKRGRRAEVLVREDRDTRD